MTWCDIDSNPTPSQQQSDTLLNTLIPLVHEYDYTCEVLEHAVHELEPLPPLSHGWHASNHSYAHDQLK